MWWRLFVAWLTKCDFALWFSLLFSCFLYSAPSSGFVLEVCALQVFHYYYYYYPSWTFPSLTTPNQKSGIVELNSDFSYLYILEYILGYTGIGLSTCPTVVRRKISSEPYASNLGMLVGASSWPGASCEKFGFLSSFMVCFLPTSFLPVSVSGVLFSCCSLEAQDRCDRHKQASKVIASGCNGRERSACLALWLTMCCVFVRWQGEVESQCLCGRTLAAHSAANYYLLSRVESWFRLSLFIPSFGGFVTKKSEVSSYWGFPIWIWLHLTKEVWSVHFLGISNVDLTAPNRCLLIPVLHLEMSSGLIQIFTGRNSQLPSVNKAIVVSGISLFLKLLSEIPHTWQLPSVAEPACTSAVQPLEGPEVLQLCDRCCMRIVIAVHNVIPGMFFLARCVGSFHSVK